MSTLLERYRRCQTRLSVVDCDIHPTLTSRPSFSVSPARWREHMQTYAGTCDKGCTARSRTRACSESHRCRSTKGGPREATSTSCARITWIRTGSNGDSCNAAAVR